MVKRVVAMLLAACLLAGCAARPHTATATPAGWFFTEPGDDTEPHSGFAWPGGRWGWGSSDQAQNTLTEAQSAYGSVGLLGFPSVLVSVYVEDETGAGWTQEQIEQSRAYLATAVQWIEEQCEQYNVSANIHYDDGTPDSGLFRLQTYRGKLVGGTESEESNSFYTMVDAVCAEVDTDALAERYGTSSIGVLFFLPVAGNAFTMVRYFSDEPYDYYEYCCIYRYDVWSPKGTWEAPATYAHEILHLFGAPDLYSGSSDPYVDDALLDYVLAESPHSIMADTYEWDGSLRYDGISQELDALTAYRLGLCSTWAGLKQFPAVGAAPVGTFTEDNTPVQWNGGAAAA